LRLSQRFVHTVLATLAILSFLSLTAHSQAFAAGESILWNFGNGTDGANPAGGLIADKSGNLYGTTADGGLDGKGTAFELTPPSTTGGDWTESILWSFGHGSDGANPFASLIIDASGNLYGTTGNGGAYGESTGGHGIVFELTPPSAIGGDWTESILWNFENGTDGNTSTAGLIMDANGNLYGTTSGGGTHAGESLNGSTGGTVFELKPPSTTGGDWTELVLWNFGKGKDGSSPFSGLIADKSGNLYGTTAYGGAYAASANNGGTAFELKPPSKTGGDWTESILWNFGKGTDGTAVYNGLLMDAGGNLYGTTLLGVTFGGDPADGTVYKLTAPSTSGGKWTESVLWDFDGTDGYWPFAGVIMDKSGNLYGTTGYDNAGTVFELMPPSTTGGNWNESILWGLVAAPTALVLTPV
jgi:hypothetical protein